MHEIDKLSPNRLALIMRQSQINILHILNFSKSFETQFSLMIYPLISYFIINIIWYNL